MLEREESPESRELVDKSRVNIIPDLELQQEMLKDLNSFILLNKNVIKALSVEANRIDAKKKEEYVQQYVMPTLSKGKSATLARSNSQRSSFLFTRTNSVTAVQQATEKKGGMSVLKKLLTAATLPKIKDQSPRAK